jgi:hypothetical protein
VTDAKHGFGGSINRARAKPVAKRGRCVVAVTAVKEFERPKPLERMREDSTLFRNAKEDAASR